MEKWKETIYEILNDSICLNDIKNKIIKEINLVTIYEFALEKKFIKIK